MTLQIVGAHQVKTFEELKGLRAEGYIRDSTLDQKDGFGPDIQRRNEERFAESHGLVMGNRWYTEFVSGRSMGKRRELQQGLKDARLDRFDVLLVDHTSRFGRNQAECIRYKDELMRLGKVVVFVSQGIISGSDRDFLAERINETLDEQYSRNLSRYVAAGLAEKAAQGLANGVPPLGYRSEKLDNGKRERKVPDPQTMPILMELLRCYASGRYSYQTLADLLNSKGHRTRNGRPFAVGSIEQVLSNRFYMGKAVYHPGQPDEEVRDGTHEVPPEVKDIWQRCQEVKDQRIQPWMRGPRARARVYLFSGVLTCNRCGRHYRGKPATARGRFYQMLLHAQNDCGVRPASQHMERLSSLFADKVLRHVHLDSGFQQAVLRALQQEAQPQSNAAVIERLDQALERTKQQYRWGDLTQKDYQRERDNLQRQLQALRATSPIVHLPNVERAAQLLNDMPALWQHPGVNDEQQQRYVQEMFDEIRLDGRELVAVKPKPTYAPHFAYLTMPKAFSITTAQVHSPRHQFVQSCLGSVDIMNHDGAVGRA